MQPIYFGALEAMTPVFASLADPFTEVAYKALWSAGELTLLAVLASLLSVAWALALAWFGVRRRKLFWSTPTITLLVYAGWLLVRYAAHERSVQFDHPRLWYQLLAFSLIFGSALGAAFFAAAVRFAWETMQQAGGKAGRAQAARDFLARPAATTPYPSFREGFVAPWDGLVYLSLRPALLRYGVIPVILNLMITGLLLVVLVLTGSALAVYVHPWFATSWGGRTLEVVLVVALSLALLAVALVTWKLLEGVLCGYFYGQLAHQVELELGVAEGEIFEIPLMQQFRDTCREIFWLLTVNGGFLFAHLVPLVGSMVAVAGSLYYDWRIFGLEYFSYPLNLRGKRWTERKAYADQHAGHTLGLGSAVFLVNFVPVLSAVVLTTAVVGAVLLNRRLAASDARAEVAKASA